MKLWTSKKKFGKLFYFELLFSNTEKLKGFFDTISLFVYLLFKLSLVDYGFLDFCINFSLSIIEVFLGTTGAYIFFYLFFLPIF